MMGPGVEGMRTAKLIFVGGKMAAGKSTLAKELAEREHAVLLVQDRWLDHLYPGEIVDVQGFAKYSSRLRDALEPHVCGLLAKGMSVVLDFPGNTRAQRPWFRRMFERASVEHELHFVDASDAVCKRQLAERSRNLPPGTPWTQEAEFEAIIVYFPTAVGGRGIQRRPAPAHLTARGLVSGQLAGLPRACPATAQASGRRRRTLAWPVGAALRLPVTRTISGASCG